MRFKNLLILLSFISFALFVFLTYLVSQEFWQQFDFDFMVKLQDKISRRADPFLSVFSYLGEADITITLAIILSIVAVFRKMFLAALGWLLIIPATMVEVLGKILIYHPSPSIEFLRTIKTTHLPPFYIYTEFSYPSGHVTRTVFLITVFLIVVLITWKNGLKKLLILTLLLMFAFLMILSRISLGEHWLSDVLGGLLLGCAAGLFSAAFILSKKYQELKIY